jgi:IS5 family transposase
MVKLLVLQQWYGLSDPELEKQAWNRLDFQHFLGYPESVPDARAGSASPGRARTSSSGRSCRGSSTRRGSTSGRRALGSTEERPDRLEEASR